MFPAETQCKHTVRTHVKLRRWLSIYESSTCNPLFLNELATRGPVVSRVGESAADRSLPVFVRNCSRSGLRLAGDWNYVVTAAPASLDSTGTCLLVVGDTGGVGGCRATLARSGAPIMVSPAK